jgi:NAD-dependent SIR2 family protein deacetylase
MTADELKRGEKAKRQRPGEITFRCQSCERQKPLEEMRVITRFFPMLVVCRDCQKEMR